MSRRKRRYENRQKHRLENAMKRVDEIGTLEDVFTFKDMFQAGKKCCNGVRWKQSTQNFERHLLSRTAVMRRKLLDGTWKPMKYTSFTLSERGKTRKIDAPHINDRQVHKVLSNHVLQPAYQPSMIYDNGASQKGKGLQFSQQRLAEHLRGHYRKYGLNGWVILVDFKQFFPSASHAILHERHSNLVKDSDLRRLADLIVDSVDGGIGLPLGVEPSQLEMIAYPSALDNHIKCQLALKGAGHYMDDYYILVPPDVDPHMVLAEVKRVAQSLRLTISDKKTIIQSIRKPFRFCKAKYTLTESGRVIVNGCRDSARRARRKMITFKAKIQSGEATYTDLWESTHSSVQYYARYNSHHKVLKLRRIFYALYGFSCESFDEFKRRTPCVI